jgi:LysM repeat protein
MSRCAPPGPLRAACNRPASDTGGAHAEKVHVAGAIEPSPRVRATRVPRQDDAGPTAKAPVPTLPPGTPSSPGTATPRPDPQRIADARVARAHEPSAQQLESRVRSTYRVREGDTLTAIAREHGLSLDGLLALNPEQRVTPDLIHVGEELRLDRRTPSRATPARADTRTEDVRVRRGDTLSAIAASRGTSVGELIELNPELRARPDLIRVGETVRAPKLEPRVTPKPEAGVTPKPEVTSKAEPRATPKPVPSVDAKPEPGVAPRPEPGASRPATLETTTQAVLGPLPYTRTASTLAERAGYVGPRAGQARFRDVELVTPDGQTQTRSLLPYANAKNVWADARGTEYYLNPTVTRDTSGRERTRYTVANEQPATGQSSPIQATRLPSGSFVVPSLGVDARERKQQLEAQGYEVTAVLGTGFIDDKGKSIVGYQYVNEARLRGEDAPASAGVSVDGLGSGKIHAGYRVSRGGEMTLLDFEGLDRTQVRARLKTLEADPDTAAINLFSHVAADEPKDLVGVLGANGSPTAFGKSRSMMVFDDEGAFVGHLQTPPTSLLDSVTLARQVYGNRAAKVLNQDGDFYAQSWFADGRQGSSDRALHYDNAMLVVRRAPPASGRPQPEDAPWAPVVRAAEDLGYWFDENVVDNVQDVAQQLDHKRQETGEAVQRWWGDTTAWWSERLRR